MSDNIQSVRKRLLIPAILCLMAMAPKGAAAQGCGDAGVCSAADFGIMARPLDSPTRLFFSENFGLGEQSTLHFETQFQLDWNVWSGIGVQFKLPYEINSGNLGTKEGPGDVSALLRLTFFENEKISVLINIGAKLPTGESDKAKDGKCLPMAYQTGLGTLDFLGGFTLLAGTWDIAAAYQLPSGKNKNTFTHELWDGNEDALKYYESPFLRRGDDVTLRVQKNFPRLRAYYSLAVNPVYRIQEDRITKDGEEIAVEGSSGLTLNLNGSAEFKLSKAWTFHLIAGVPVISREAIPDGLTRTFVVIAGFGLNFPD